MLLYFDDCEKIWRGCPATDQIGGGIESTDLDLEDTSVDTAILHDVTNSLSGRSKPSASKNINRLAVSSSAAGPHEHLKVLMVPAQNLQNLLKKIQVTTVLKEIWRTIYQKIKMKMILQHQHHFQKEEIC